MGAGRKKKTLRLKEKPRPSWTVNCSAPARNLRKSDLGAVIFGCKHNTFEECLSKQLFGLPAMHFAYVKNVSPGLPLFLFNYSDRKLHGIFEAASQGQMNIDPYGWTADGSEYTPYAAQVWVRIQMQCQPLLEDQFGQIIADNYYEQRLFWFELDLAQTRKLISLFSSISVPVSPSRPQNTFEAPHLQAGSAYSNQSNMQWGSWDAPRSGREQQILEGLIDAKAAEKCVKELVQPKPNCALSYPSIVISTNTSLPQKKWSALFETSATSDTPKEDDDFKARSAENFPHSDPYNMGWKASCVASCLEGKNQQFEAHADESAMGIYEEIHVGSKSECELLYPSALSEVASSFQQSPSCEALDIFDTTQEGEYFKALPSDRSLPHEDESKMEWGSSCDTPHLHGKNWPSKASTDDDVTEIYEEELLLPKAGCEHSYSSSLLKEMDSDGKENTHPFVMAEVHSEDGCVSEAMAVAEMKVSSIQSVVAKLVQEIEGLKASQLKQVQKISSLEKELVESKVEIQQLKNRCQVLESGLLSSVGHVQEALVELCDEARPKIDDSILIVGGFDGSSWLSALDCYSPSRDTMNTLKPMTFVRSYASAATLNGELYIFGGVDGDVWHDTVESYNPTSDQWVSRPSLNQKKGSLAGATLYDKIFAVGGGNGVECYSEVEMLDMSIGRWITTQSMLQKRFAPAAAEINGTLYVVGGYDGRNYLNSVERFDPREHSWTKLGSMSTKRGCHSLTVLNEKLYALGGFNGAKMVSAVEIFDPRLGSWMTGEPLNNSRGYSGAVVIGEKIYVIGGVKGSDEILDTIECYKEGCSWKVTNLKAVGKRCFFSANIL